MNAELLMFLGGAGAFGLTLHWVRGRDLREKYAIAWMVVACALLLCGLFPQAIMGLATAFHLSYTSAMLFLALTAIYLFSLMVSVSLSHQHRRTIRLTQEVAILEHRLRRLELELAQQEFGRGQKTEPPLAA